VSGTWLTLVEATADSYFPGKHPARRMEHLE